LLNPNLFQSDDYEKTLNPKIKYEKKHKKSEISSLNDFKEILRIKNKSMDCYITPFQNNLTEKLNRKKEIQKRINFYKNKNFSLNNLIQTENLNQLYKENIHKLDNTKYLMEIKKKNFNENIDKVLKSSRNNENENISIKSYNSNNNLNIMDFPVIDRIKDSLSANLNTLNNVQIEEKFKINNNLNNINEIYKKNNNSSKVLNNENSNGKSFFPTCLMMKKNSNDNEENKPYKILDLNNDDKEKILKCVLEKLPNDEKNNLIKKKQKELNIFEFSKKESQTSPLNQEKYTENLQSRNFTNTKSLRDESFYMKSKLENKNSNADNTLSPSSNSLIKKPKVKKKLKEKSEVYIPFKNPLKSRKFDNNDLNLEKDKKHNIELTQNINKILVPNNKGNSTRNKNEENGKKTLQIKSKDINKNINQNDNFKLDNKGEKNIDPYENYFSETEKEKFPNYSNNNEEFIFIENNYYKENHKEKSNFKYQNEKKLDKYNVGKKIDYTNYHKEGSNLDSFIYQELKKDKLESKSSNKLLFQDDCNSHFLGAAFKNKHNKIAKNSNEKQAILIEHKNRATPLEVIKQNRRESRSNSPKTNESVNDTDSYKFSDHSSLDLENNILELKSKQNIDFEKIDGISKSNKGTSIENKYLGINEFSNTNLQNKYSKNMIISEIKNERINQTLNESIFKEVKKTIININFGGKEEEAKIEVPFTKRKSNTKLINNSKEIYQNNIENKIYRKNRKVVSPVSFVSNDRKDNQENSFHLIHNQNETKKSSSKTNSSIIKSNTNNNLILINLQTVNTDPNKQNSEINKRKNTNKNIKNQNNNKIIIFNNTTNKNSTIESVENTNKKITETPSKDNKISDGIFNRSDEKRNSSFNETNYNLPSANNTSNSKILKSKSKIFNKINSPFKNVKLKRVFRNNINNLKSPYFSKNESDTTFNKNIDLTNLSTVNNLNEKNKIVLDFNYANSKAQNKKKVEGDNALNNNKSIINNNKQKVNKSFTMKDLNIDKDLEKISSVDNSKISNDNGIESRSNSKKKTSRSNSIKNNQEKHYRSSNKKESYKDRFSTININIKDTPQYFINRNIMEEYEKIKSHTKKPSENQIIFSELKYKLDLLHENKINYTNLMKEEFNKGNLDNNLILPKI